MKKLGIIGAMEIEIESLLGEMEGKTSFTRSGSTFWEGTLEGLPVVVVQCGVGKVNAAICTQILCDCCGVSCIINTGVAGSLCPSLDIGDFVVSQDAMYHDFDVHTLDPKYSVGQVPGMDVLAFPADEVLMTCTFAAAEKIHPGHTKIGRIASGDQFVCRREQKDQIIRDTHALCTEMEGVAVAQTAYRSHVPFVILRAISDKADDSASMDYPTFERIAAYRSAQVTRALAKHLADM